ncbi:MAG TPA: dTDP-4-dehydrorhamnose reductase [Stellaceae bacterium]|nr:dTDP-4-dehydrorhamnose reductase [Stellaceae bacterium]
MLSPVGHTPGMSRKILVIGRIGQIGHELHRGRWPARSEVEFVERPQIDLTRTREARDIVIAARPAIVVNAAAYTAVDAAESDPAAAFAVNRDGPAAIAEACREIGAAMVHFSTDYVYDGRKAGAYVETDPIGPLSVYGASKAEGDAAVAARLDRHAILRTSWVYSAIGQNFVKTMLRLGAERDRLGIVDDQHGSPTSAADLAGATIAVCTALAAGKDDGYGVFHLRGGGTTSWFGFARAIFREAAARGLKTPRLVEPITTEAYPTPAARPRNSVLDCGKIAHVYGIVAPPWERSLTAVLDELLAATPRAAVTEGAL